MDFKFSGFCVWASALAQVNVLKVGSLLVAFSFTKKKRFVAAFQENVRLDGEDDGMIRYGDDSVEDPTCDSNGGLDERNI